MAEVARGKTLDELASQLPMPKDALLASVAYYNRHARRQQDPLFGKVKEYLSPLREAPFVAYDLSVDKAFFPAHTFGGLRTSVDSQVLNGFGETIPGLYAAGRTSAGLPVAPYIASGISLGDGSCFGRRAGRHALEVRS